MFVYKLFSKRRVWFEDSTQVSASDKLLTRSCTMIAWSLTTPHERCSLFDNGWPMCSKYSGADSWKAMGMWITLTYWWMATRDCESFALVGSPM